MFTSLKKFSTFVDTSELRRFFFKNNVLNYIRKWRKDRGLNFLMTDNYFCCFCFAWTLLQFSSNETAYGLDNRYSQRSSKFDSGSRELQKRLAVAFPVKVKVNMWHNVNKERTTEQVQMNLSVCYNISPFTHCLKWNNEWN